MKKKPSADDIQAVIIDLNTKGLIAEGRSLDLARRLARNETAIRYYLLGLIAEFATREKITFRDLRRYLKLLHFSAREHRKFLAFSGKSRTKERRRLN